MKVSAVIENFAELDGMVRAGFESVTLDLGVFCPAINSEGYGKDDSVSVQNRKRERFQYFLERQNRKAVSYDVVRAQHLNWNTKRTDLKEFLLRVGKDCIEACAQVGGRSIIIQPLFSGICKSEEWKENQRYYLELGKIAHREGIRILLENQCRNINGHLVRGICTNTDTVMEWIDALNSEFQDEEFGFCLDSNACYICRQDMGDMVIALGKSLKAVQISLCDDSCNVGRLPSVGIKAASNGSNDWTSLICGLRKIEFEGNLIIDAGKTLKEFSHLLRPQLYPFIKSVADFFKWQIDMEKSFKKFSSRILFGAGNMCRIYLEKYGAQYPPLFVCDNNSALWDTKVCGLEVKPPTVLQNLSEGSVVVICNTFYKETAEQLRKMGVKNIGAFNDEYLQT